MLAALIRGEHVLVDLAGRKASYRLKAGQVVELAIPPAEPVELVAEEVDFVVLHEDADLVVLSKPPGVVVHPACGHSSGTLVHGLLARCADLSGISGAQRPGIVHRLDRDTSGLMVVAKNDRTHHFLIELFKARKIEKLYHAILDGRPATGQGRIAAPIGRHPVSRKKMAVVGQGGREAATNWKVLEELTGPYTYVEVRPETGRTHQIRVHMAHLGHPVAGDDVYGKKRRKHDVLEIRRQCLHASELSFIHPRSGRRVRFIAPLWPDMAELLAKLRDGAPGARRE